MLQLSDHFSSNEFACKCGCGEKEVDPQLIKVLELIRRTVNRPITIVSGRRCKNHNAAVGGAKHSQHVLGNAADIKVRDMSPKEVHTAINAIHRSGVHIGGLGLYKTFVHVDVRKSIARWTG